MSVSYRYVKLVSLTAYNVTSSSYDAIYTSCAELNLVLSGTPLSRSGWTVSADSEEDPDYAADKVLDGDPDTLWHTRFTTDVTGQPHEIILDCGASVEFDAVRQQNREISGSLNGAIGDYEIYGSDDGSTWTLIGSGTANTGTPPTASEEIDLPAAPLVEGSVHVGPDGSIQLVAGALAAPYTLAGYFRFDADIDQATDLFQSYQGTRNARFRRIATPSPVFRLRGTNASLDIVDVDFTSLPANETWFYAVLQVASDGAITAYYREEGGSTWESQSIPAGSYSVDPTDVYAATGLDGNLCYLRAWNAILDTTELLAEMQSPTAVRTTDIVWSVDLRSTVDLEDQTGNDNDAALDGTGQTSSEETPSFEGPSVIEGSLSAAEAQDVASLSGTTLITGSLSATEGQDQTSISGLTTLSGILFAVEAPDQASLSGQIILSASLTAIESQDVAAFTGLTPQSTGYFQAQEFQDVAVVSGVAGISGALSATETPDVAAFVGTGQKLIDDQPSVVLSAYGAVTLYGNGAGRLFTI